MTPRLQRRPGFRRKGTAILEFAIGSGVLLAAFTGVFQFGYALIQYNRLLSAVAQGARYAAVVPYDSTTTTPSTAFLTSVRNMVVYGSPGAGNTPAVAGLSAANVKLTVTFTNAVPSAMTVFISGYTIDSLFGTSVLRNKPKVTFPYQGVWTPL